MPLSAARLKRAFRPTWEVLRLAAQGYARDNKSLMGAGIAFWALLSLSPLLVIVVVIASLAYDAETARTFMVAWLNENIGGKAAEFIIRSLETASAPGATTLPGLISLVLMLWSASRLFHALQMALNQIWNVRAKTRASLGKKLLHLLRKRALTFLLILSVALLLLVSLALSTALPIVARLMTELPGGWYLYRSLEVSLSIVVICVAVGLVYTILPDARIPWRFAWKGAIITGVLLVLGKQLLAWYLARYSIGSFGAPGSVVALLLWVYFSTQVFFFGAELTQAYAKVAGWPREPEPIAEGISARRTSLPSKETPR